MRHHRVRYTKPKCRDNRQRVRAVRTIEGVSRFKHSKAGFALKHEHLCEQLQKQGRECPKCHELIAIGDATFEAKTWNKEDGLPPVVHKKCKMKETDHGRTRA